MRSWAQRTARWTVKTLPFSFGRAGGAVGADGAPACPPRADDTGERRHPAHERGLVPPSRGRHAAPPKSRKARVRDAG
jgi:hypothetical protein